MIWIVLDQSELAAPGSSVIRTGVALTPNERTTVTESQLTAEDLTPRERLVFIASCQLKEVDGPEALIHDP